MRAYILVVCFAMAVVAHPDVGGYAYNGLQQQNQHILPQHGHSVQPLVHQQLPAEHSFSHFATPQMTYSGPDPSPPNSIEQIVAPEDTEAVVATMTMPHALPQQQDSYNMAYQHSAMPYEAGYAYAPMPTKVHKHIYVHVPPKDFDEEDVVQPRVHHQVGPKQKHYKIVFIKAPAAPAIRAPIVPPTPQNEEKTLIYVLHKKPEQVQDIVIPTPVPTKPSKPEVYFIKYKTKKEEAPVYGPPPPVEMDPRNLASTNDYRAPAAEDFAAMSSADFAAVPAPITTTQPASEEHMPQFVSEVPSEVYSTPPIMPAIHVAEPEPTIAVPAPSNQYLAPDATPTTKEVEQKAMHLPADSYGPPTSFFIKKKK